MHNVYWDTVLDRCACAHGKIGIKIQDLLKYQLAANIAGLHGILQLKTSNNIKINIQT